MQQNVLTDDGVDGDMVVGRGESAVTPAMKWADGAIDRVLKGLSDVTVAIQNANLNVDMSVLDSIDDAIRGLSLEVDVDGIQKSIRSLRRRRGECSWPASSHL